MKKFRLFILAILCISMCLVCTKDIQVLAEELPNNIVLEGASEGIGLGHEFLRHIERTKMMIHVVDAASSEGRDPIDDIYKINAELEAYNPEIAKRPQVIAANKIDAIYDTEGDPVEAIKAEFEPKGIKNEVPKHKRHYKSKGRSCTGNKARPCI